MFNAYNLNIKHAQGISRVRSMLWGKSPEIASLGVILKR
jgi:hypothetical protein